MITYIHISVMSPPIIFLHQLMFWLIFFLVSAASSRLNTIPRLSPIGPKLWQHHLDHPQIISAEVSDFQTFFYNQTLDHFNYRPESYDRFQQRYVIDFRYWGGANASAPIFVFLGEESPLDDDLQFIGFLSDNAPQFNALSVYIEHRYYGKSIPFGSREEAFKNTSTLGYFNSAQAIADYAAIIIHLKENLNAENSPVIVIGASYGGMLASWFRLKYPHIALGALASSAPILYFDDITPQDGYYNVVSKDFREASETCYQTIKKSWAEIDEVASQSNGLSILSKKFQTCKPLNGTAELKDALNTIYADAAQYNAPPIYPVNEVCGGIDGGAYGDNILSKIFGGVVAYKGNLSCYINAPKNESETTVGWRWQTCSDMVIPIGYGNDSMFPSDPFNLTDYIKECKSLYGVPPRPHWITTYYGGHSIKLILQRFGSNIIFSNGLRDPYSSGGVLEDLSQSIVAVKTVNGSHCLDVLRAKETDPEWLITQRKIEIKIMKEWISNYYADLHKSSLAKSRNQ